jgi:5-methylcytosine-specific restriction endonuclease McrA
MRLTASGADRRCSLHPLQARPRSRAYNELARAIVANATHCGICGEPPRASDEFVCDHVIPRAHGGPSVASNLRAVHRSCNNKKNSRVANWREQWL